MASWLDYIRTDIVALLWGCDVIADTRAGGARGKRLRDVEEDPVVATA